MMSELDEMTLDLCHKYGIDFWYASEAIDDILYNGMEEYEAVDKLIELYGDRIYSD